MWAHPRFKRCHVACVPIWLTWDGPIASIWRYWAHPATAAQGVGPTVYNADASGPVRLPNVPWGFIMIMRPAHELRDRDLGPAVFMNVVLQAHPSAAHTGPGPIQFRRHDMGSLECLIAAAPAQPHISPLHAPAVVDLMIRHHFITATFAGGGISTHWFTFTFAGMPHFLAAGNSSAPVFQPSRKLMGPLGIVE
ncbi:hypothetical protein C8R48DRAFT_680396 [Suillus tomentosus]|nr:hypothetical protein C8R48DRAFT_680396 [Suillus tomentosus]